MKTQCILIALALGASTCLLTAQEGTPDPQQPPPQLEQGGPGKPGGFHLLPPRANEVLKLTAEQAKQLADLEAEVKAKIEQILTPEQLHQLKQMHPPRPPGGPGGKCKREGGPDREEPQAVGAKTNP